MAQTTIDCSIKFYKSIYWYILKMTSILWFHDWLLNKWIGKRLCSVKMKIGEEITYEHYYIIIK